MKRYLLLILVALIVSFTGENLFAQPSAPTNLTATQQKWDGFSFVKLQWKYSGMTMLRQDKIFFNIYRKDGAISDTGTFRLKYSRVMMDEWLEMLTGSAFWFDKDVQSGETYSYFVKAVNFNGESPASDTVQLSIDSLRAKATITGTLTSAKDNSPIINGRVSLIPVFGWQIKTTRTDSSGNFAFHVVTGSYIVLATAPGYFGEYYDNAFNIFNATKINLAASDSMNINFSLKPKAVPQKYMLSGTVEDSLKNPVRARIDVFSVIFNSFSYRYYRAVTDSAGNYSVPVRDGDTVIVFAHPMNKDYYSQFYNGKTNFLDADRIGISGDVSNIDFVLQHKIAYNNGISGEVMNTDSTGIPSVVVAIRLGLPLNQHKRYAVVSDSLGAYSFSNLFPGNYILLAVPQDGYKPTFFTYNGTQTLRWRNADSVVVTTTSVVSGINFTVSALPDSGAATVDGVVSDNNGNPLAGAIVSAYDQNQQVYSFGITNQNGKYTITGLVPGSYSISSDLFGYSSSSASTTSLDYNSTPSTTESFTMTPDNVTSVQNSNNNIITNFSLEQNYPNPFNPTTIISYSLPYTSKVVLKVYNLLGQEVASLINSQQTAGVHQVVFDGSNLASGVYFYRIQAGNFSATKKLILMK